jgi:hypothetical protein
MKNIAFISRHRPTAQQVALVSDAFSAHGGATLVHVGDADAFSFPALREAVMGFDGAVVVNAAAALNLAYLASEATGFFVGVFEVEAPSRPPEGGAVRTSPPAFKAVHFWQAYTSQVAGVFLKAEMERPIKI